MPASCGPVGPEGAERLGGSSASLHGLGRTVLEAVSRGDVAAVERHRLTREEHDRVVWPELPASAPEVGFPLDYVWPNIQNRHRRSLGRVRAMLEGEDVAFRDAECRGATERFETFEVRTDCWVLFELHGRAGTFEVQLFEDVVVRGGGYKYFRLYDEEPRQARGGTSATSAGARHASGRPGGADG